VILPFQIEPEAAVELDEAANWYEEKRLDLGRDFLQAVDEALAFIASWPRSGKPVPNVPEGFAARRTPVRRFPYHVVYLETPSAIRILAFAHDRRRPSYWHTRLTS
jgi:plasmid stabilization system protein ParE